MSTRHIGQQCVKLGEFPMKWGVSPHKFQTFSGKVRYKFSKLFKEARRWIEWNWPWACQLRSHEKTHPCKDRTRYLRLTHCIPYARPRSKIFKEMRWSSIDWTRSQPPWTCQEAQLCHQGCWIQTKRKAPRGISKLHATPPDQCSLYSPCKTPTTRKQSHTLSLSVKV
jgi:hypothetical protein